MNHKVIGDPVYGCAKTYTVKYQCGSSPHMFEKSLAAEAGWGDKAVLLDCKGTGFDSPVILTGKWIVNQSNGYTGDLALQQDAAGGLTGTVGWNGSYFGTLTGQISGNKVTFTISYPGNVKGHYSGTIFQDGKRIINGTTKGSTGETAQWDASRIGSEK